MAEETQSTDVNDVRDGTLNWDSMPFQVAIGETFESIADVLKYRTAAFGKRSVYNEDPTSILALDEVPDDTADANKLKSMYGLEDESDEEFNTPILRPFFQDTRVGANDAVNCVWQFNRDDDIMHPVNTIDKAHHIGLGRVYASTTQMNQQICWFTFGVPYYTKLAAFYKLAFDDKLIRLNQHGYEDSLTLGNIFGAGLSLAFTFPILGIKWLASAAGGVNQTYEVNRFYELRACMHLYYKYVDSILAQWLVSVGLYDNGVSVSENGKVERSQTEFDRWTANSEYIPDALKATGASAWDILKRRAQNASFNIVEGPEDEERRNKLLKEVPEGMQSFKDWSGDSNDSKMVKLPYLSEEDADKLNNLRTSTGTTLSNSGGNTDPYLDNYGSWKNTFWSSALGSTQFVGFRINKDVDASESFSNSTSPSVFAETFNSTVRSANANILNNALKAGTGNEVLDFLQGTITGLVKGVSDSFGFSGLASAVASGAFLDVPEQYSGSDFNKSHSISLQLRSPYGDMISIYQSIIFPLALLLAGALPRQTGNNSYTQPFLCRVYCKGMFSVPMGIIDSIQIRRGSSEFGWTHNNLPTCVDVSISIKDMSPVMYMPIADSGLISMIENTTSFKEYMLTLSGTGLWDRISTISRWRRNVQFNAHMLRNRYANPAFWSHEVSQWMPVRLVSALYPKTTISRH